MQWHRRLSQTLFGMNRIIARFYSANATLYSEISPLGSPKLRITPVLDKWAEEGKPTSFNYLQRMIRDLRKRRRYSHALEICEWIERRPVYKLSPSQYAVQIDLIGKVRGYASAESYFGKLSENDKTSKTYGALLHCYIRQRNVDKALRHVEKMEENGISLSIVSYNDLMSLYLKSGQHERVIEVLENMKENGVCPINVSYRICISSCGMRSDVAGMENILAEMESKPDIVIDWRTYATVADVYFKTGSVEKANNALRKAEEQQLGKDNEGFNSLISVHAKLGNKDHVLRLWSQEKATCKNCKNRDYLNVLKSLVWLRELEEGENLLKEWESSGNVYDFQVPYVIIRGYIYKGLYEKADSILKSVMERGEVSTPDNWGRVAANYLDMSEVEKALEYMKVAVASQDESKGLTFGAQVITRFLGLLGTKGSFEDAEAFLSLLKTAMPLSRDMYHVLLKSYVSEGKEINGILKNMKTNGLEVDEETEKIITQANEI